LKNVEGFFLPSQERQLNMVLSNHAKLEELVFALTLTLKESLNFASSVEGLIYNVVTGSLEQDSGVTKF